jgi:hypothetical protein
MVLGFGILFMAFAEFYKFLKRRCMAPLVRHVDMTKSVTPTKAVRELDLIAVDKGATTEYPKKAAPTLVDVAENQQGPSTSKATVV